MKETKCWELGFLLGSLVILLVAPIPIGYASPMPDAEFLGSATYGTSNGRQTQYRYSAGRISNEWDNSWSWPLSGQVHAYSSATLTAGYPSEVDAYGTVFLESGFPVGYFEARASANLVYYWQVIANDPLLPVRAVPAIVVAEGHIEVVGLTGDDSGAGASAYAVVGPLSNPWAYPIVSGSVEGTGRWSKWDSVVVNVFPGDILEMEIEARGNVMGQGMMSNVSFNAVIDPTVQIDPNWMVWYNGEYVPGAKLYSLNFSTGFSPAVPEPESCAMLLAGLGLVGLKARRRKQ